MAADIQALVDAETDLRVLPVSGRGPVQNLQDLLTLPEVDAAIVPSDVMAFMRDQDLQSKALPSIGYLAKLASEDVHIVASRSIKSLEELRGKRVNIGPISDARHVTGALLFSMLGIEIVPTEDGIVPALKEIQEGKTDAVIFLGPKKSPAIAALPRESFQLLPVTLNENLLKIYAPTFISAEDYPALLEGGRTIDTLSVAIVLAAKNQRKGTTEYEQFHSFISALFLNAGDLQEGQRFANWAETNLAADVRDWTRTPASKDWLESSAAISELADNKSQAGLAMDIESFLQAREMKKSSAPLNSNRLYDEFIEWKRQRK
jgi:TRAP-type uncharacterized transport system substrate-binding protein